MQKLRRTTRNLQKENVREIVNVVQDTDTLANLEREMANLRLLLREKDFKIQELESRAGRPISAATVNPSEKFGDKMKDQTQAAIIKQLNLTIAKNEMKIQELEHIIEDI